MELVGALCQKHGFYPNSTNNHQIPTTSCSLCQVWTISSLRLVSLHDTSKYQVLVVFFYNTNTTNLQQQLLCGIVCFHCLEPRATATAHPDETMLRKLLRLNSHCSYFLNYEYSIPCEVQNQADPASAHSFCSTALVSHRDYEIWMRQGEFSQFSKFHKLNCYCAQESANN